MTYIAHISFSYSWANGPCSNPDSIQMAIPEVRTLEEGERLVKLIEDNIIGKKGYTWVIVKSISNLGKLGEAA